MTPRSEATGERTDPAVRYQQWSRAKVVNEYEPFDIIEPGDVVRINGSLRKVRTVTRTPDDDALRYVTFAKLRRSRYSRPTTTLTRNDLKSGNYRFQGVIAHAARCTTDLECAVQRAAEDSNAPYPDQCRTVGVIR